MNTNYKHSTPFNLDDRTATLSLLSWHTMQNLVFLYPHFNYTFLLTPPPLLSTLLIITQTFITASRIPINWKFSEIHAVITFQGDKVSRIDSFAQFDKSIFIKYSISFATISKSFIHIILLNFIELTQLAPRCNIYLQPTLMYRCITMMQIMCTCDDNITGNEYTRSPANLILIIPPYYGNDMFIRLFVHIMPINKTKRCITE
jgi:hypothetical protein